MNKAVNSNPITETVPAEDILIVYAMVANYRPLIRKSMKNIADAEDLEQEVIIKLLSRFATQPDWWNRVANKKAYLVTTIRNKALDFKTKKSIFFVDYGEDENKAKTDNSSDNGGWVEDLNAAMDLEPKRLLIKEILDGFSDYEQQLLQLNFVEGVKPRDISKIMKIDPARIQMDCNRVKAVFRAKLRKRMASLH